MPALGTFKDLEARFLKEYPAGSVFKDRNGNMTISFGEEGKSYGYMNFRIIDLGVKLGLYTKEESDQWFHTHGYTGR